MLAPTRPSCKRLCAATTLAALAIGAIACAPRERVAGLDSRSPRVQKQLSFSILEDYDKGEDLAAIAQDFDRFRDLGITTWRGSFGWDDYEPERGTYDFTWLHQFADLAAAHGITLRPYIGYTPAWASGGGRDADRWNDPPVSLDDWALFVRTLATEMRRHANIASYEIYNEENAKQWWDGDARQYRGVLERAAREIRRVDPRLQVIVGGMTYPDTDWLEAICGAGVSELIDVVPFHAYPETWTPPGVGVERYLGPAFPGGFVRDADAACGRKPIWINETGFATTPGQSEDEQADWWVRAIATFAAEPRIEHIGVYEIKDLEPARDAIGGAPNYHLGLLRTNRSEKPAFATVKKLAALLAAGPIVVEDDRISIERGDSDDVFRHAFELADGRHVAFVWSRVATHVVDLSVHGRTAHDVTLAPGMARVLELDR